jgi:hypothetical protein
MRTGTSTHKNSTYAPSGIEPNYTRVCSTKPGDTGPGQVFSSYTATTTTVTLYTTAGGFSLAYTKQ